MDSRLVSVGLRWRREELCIVGDRVLGHLLLQVLNQTILHEPESPADADEDDDESNAKAYAELIQFLNDRSLSLMRETADDGRKAVKILMGY